MESTQIQASYEPPLAAMPQLREKPRQGFETRKTTGKPGSSSCNFTVTLGLRATVVENGVRETYSARYYNPATGRFLSRDPEDGGARDPASLHKYLYANGDPVNGLDPSGRADATETGLTFALIGTAPVPELTALVAAAAEAAGDAAILASEVAQTLAEAEVAIARGAYAAAAALIQSAFARYMAVAMEETRWGAIVRFLTCETIALVLTEIIDKNYELPVKWQIRVDIYSGGTCLAVAFGK